MSNFQNNTNKQKLSSAIEANQQMVVVFEAEAFEKEWSEDNTIHSAPTRPVTVPYQLRDNIKAGAGYTIDALSVAKFSKMAADMGMNGQVILKTYDKKSFVIFKSTGNLHHFVTQLKQRFSNSKHISVKPNVIKMAIGNAQALKGGVRGGMITFAIFTTINIMDYIIRDQATFARLAGTIASDFAKVSAGVLVGITAHTGALYALPTFGYTSAISLAVGPIAASIVIGIGFGILLGAIDNHFKLTEKLIIALEKLFVEVEQVNYEVKRTINYIDQNPIQAFSRIFGIPAIYF